MAEVYFRASGSAWACRRARLPDFARANQGGNVKALARVLFGPYFFPFEVTSILLIVAAIGAMLHGRRRIAEEAIIDQRRTSRALEGPRSKQRPSIVAEAIDEDADRLLPDRSRPSCSPSGRSGVLVRRNALVIFMSVELQLNAVNLALIAFSRQQGNLDGQVLAFFSMVVAAAEVVVGLAIIVTVVPEAAAARTSTTRTC